MQGWWTMESWKRHTTARNHLLFATDPLIDWKCAVDRVVVHHGTSAMLTGLHTFELRRGNILERPHVSIHIDMARKPHHKIEFQDYGLDGFEVQWASEKISVPKNVKEMEMSLRFDIKGEVLHHYYEQRYTIDLQAGRSTAQQPAEKLMKTLRGFQKFLKRTFAPSQADISLNSQAAMIPLSGRSILCSLHESFLRFEWTLLYCREKALVQHILSHEWSSNGTLLVMNIRDIEQGGMFQLQATRENLREHQKMTAVETWCTVESSGYGKPPYTMTEDISLRSKNSLFAKLDVSHIPCESSRNPFPNPRVESFPQRWYLFLRQWNTAG